MCILLSLFNDFQFVRVNFASQLYQESWTPTLLAYLTAKCIACSLARSHSLLLLRCCLCHVTLIFQHCSPLPIYTHDSLRTSCINISISSFQIEFVFISQNYYVTEPKSWPRALSGFLSPFSLFLCVCHDIKIAGSSEFLYSWSSPESVSVCGLIMWQWAWLVFNVVEGRGIQICGNHERLKILLWFRLKKLSKQSKLTARQCWGGIFLENFKQFLFKSLLNTPPLNWRIYFISSLCFWHFYNNNKEWKKERRVSRRKEFERRDCAYQKEITAHNKRAMSQFICDTHTETPKTQCQVPFFFSSYLPTIHCLVDKVKEVTGRKNW